MSSFKECDWQEFHGNVSEPMPPNMPEPRGEEVKIRLHVDSDHAGDQLVRRSRTGFFACLNSVPLIWFSKCQRTDRGDFRIWCRVRRNEERNGSRQGAEVQTAHDGHPS
jgi:hypothetical protein